MQQSDIVKLCAGSLRDYLKREHAIEELKSSHAHELAAAFWGYKSKNALLADTKYPLENLPQAKIIVLAPTAPIDERRAQLEGLPPFLPNNYILGAENLAYWCSSFAIDQKFDAHAKTSKRIGCRKLKHH